MAYNSELECHTRKHMCTHCEYMCFLSYTCFTLSLRANISLIKSLFNGYYCKDAFSFYCISLQMIKLRFFYYLVGLHHNFPLLPCHQQVALLPRYNMFKFFLKENKIKSEGIFLSRSSGEVFF